MLKNLIVALVLLCSVAALAQSTTVTGTVTDPSGQAWAGGSISYVFQANGYPPSSYQWNGAPLPPQYLTPQLVTLSGTGTFSITGVPSTGFITPINSSWKFTICPYATSNCGILTIAINGSTQNLTSAIANVITTPSAAGTLLPLAYADSSIQTQVRAGALYYNTLTANIKYYDGTAWHVVGSGGGGAVASVSNADGTLVISPTTGAVVASLNLASANTWTGLITVQAGTGSYGQIHIIGIGTNPTALELDSSPTGGKAWQTVSGSSAFAGTYFYLYDATTTGGIPFAVNWAGAKNVLVDPQMAYCWANGSFSFTSDTCLTRAGANIVEFGHTIGAKDGTVEFAVLALGTGHSLTGVQGTDNNIMSAGTIASGTVALLCTDSNGGATTTGCPSSGAGITLETNGTLNSSQTLLNHVNTSSIAFTNPTGGTQSANLVSTGNGTIVGFSSAGVYGAYTAGSGISLTSNTIVNSSPMVFPASGIPQSTGGSWGTSLAKQGTDTNLLTSGTISGGAGTNLCTDANGGASTAGCTSITGSGTTGYMVKYTSATTVGNSACDDGVTTAGIFTCGEPGAFGGTNSGIGFSGYTVAGLPSAATVGASFIAVVTDGNGTAGACTGGGSTPMIAISNGSAWNCR